MGLQGLLGEIVRKEEEAQAKADARRAKKGSAYDRFKAPVAEQERKEEDAAVSDGTSPAEADDTGRRWKRTLRAMFNTDAVVAFQNDLIDSYQSEEYANACKSLERNWPPG